MREIKFRYTVKRDNGYVFSRIFTLEEIERGAVFAWANANLVDIEQVTKEQFTGLRDKNGREIYEGDKVFVDCSIEHSLNIHGIVKYSFGSFNIVDGEEIHYSFSEIPDRIYLNGNIHEYPELLS